MNSDGAGRRGQWKNCPGERVRPRGPSKNRWSQIIAPQHQASLLAYSFHVLRFKSYFFPPPSHHRARGEGKEPSNVHRPRLMLRRDEEIGDALGKGRFVGG